MERMEEGTAGLGRVKRAPEIEKPKSNADSPEIPDRGEVGRR